MFQTIITYEADGTQRDFAVPFAFIKKEYVKAYKSEATPAGTLVGDLQPVGFSWMNAGMIQLDEVVRAGMTITIQRETYADNPLVDFQDAAIVTEADLDLAVLQMLHVAQEARDRNSYELLEAAQSLLETAKSYVEAAERVEEALENFNKVLQEIQDALAAITDTSLGSIGGPVATEYFTSDGITTSFQIARPNIGRNILLLAFDAASRRRLYFSEKAALDGSIVLELATPLPAGTRFGVVFLRSVNTDGETSLIEELAARIETKADASVLDAFTEEVNTRLATKANAATLVNYALKEELTAELEVKADASALDAYVTKEDSEAALAKKANAASLRNYVLEADMDAELAYKADLVGGYIKAEQMPPGAIPVNHTVADETDLTGLTTAVPNDRAKVTYTGDIWLLWTSPPTDAGNWENLTEAGDPVDIGVSSVAGKTGAVTLTPGDISGLPAALDDKANASDVAAVIAWMPKIKLYSGTIAGNGSAVAFIATHNMGTDKVNVQTFDSSGNAVVFGTQIISTAAVKLTAVTAPANGSTFTVIIIGITA